MLAEPDDDCTPGGSKMWGMGLKRRIAWPQGMRITVEDHVQNIKMLLFIRQAWSIARDIAIPELSPTPDTGPSRIPNEPGREVWEKRWKHEWDRSWAWFDSRETQISPTSQDGLREIPAPGQGFHRVVPPFWPAQYGEAGFDLMAFNAWDVLSHPAFPSYAERDSTPALIAAWKEGLTTVIGLPLKGYFAHRLNDSHLVVSHQTRKDPESYSLALNSWRRDSGSQDVVGAK